LPLLAIGQVAVYPLEICKTRLAIAAPGVYAGLLDCLRSVVQREGVGALYKGLGTSVIGIVPYAGIDLAVNSALKDVASRVYSARGEEPGVSAVLACGMISSTMAMLCTYPINLVRTRLQASGMPGTTEYAGPLDVVRQAVRAGGLGALYQGLLPNLLKVLPATSISYAVYDRLCKDAPGGKKGAPPG
jgi:solute carrier family 25 phosphate transporter 23/24/25/41